MASRRLQEHVENLARKKQREFETLEGWKNKTKYYKHWEKQNSKYGNWTSEDYYQHSQAQYDGDMKRKMKEELLEKRRNKLRHLFLEEEKEYGMELLESPRSRCSPRREREVSTEVLKDINIGLKQAQEEKRRHEAELKLYNQWRNENSILRDYESNQNCASLKLAWLDQQIEKRMARDKRELETKKMLEDRDRLLKREDELMTLELEQKDKKEKILLEQIDAHMKDLKINECKKEKLLREYNLAQDKNSIFLNLLERRQKVLEKRKQKELQLFNINQSKTKLRKKALEIEDQLRNERHLLEDIERLKITEALANEEEKCRNKEAIHSYLKYVKDQQILEHQRNEYISFIFDSEAKVMLQKQERIWHQEQESRDKLLDNVLSGLKKQLDEKIERNKIERQKIEEEKENVQKNVEEFNRQINEEKTILERKKHERRMDFDKQINEKRLYEMQEEMKEQERKRLELENVKKEEEKLKNELMQMQRGKYHPSRYQRQKPFW